MNHDLLGRLLFLLYFALPAFSLFGFSIFKFQTHVILIEFLFFAPLPGALLWSLLVILPKGTLSSCLGRSFVVRFDSWRSTCVWVLLLLEKDSGVLEMVSGRLWAVRFLQKGVLGMMGVFCQV